MSAPTCRQLAVVCAVIYFTLIACAVMREHARRHQHPVMVVCRPDGVVAPWGDCP